jgi:acyl carrier protein
MSQTEKKLYRVLRNVGFKKNAIIGTQSKDELCLDDLDSLLLVYFFESEFNVEVDDEDISYLNTVSEVNRFLERKVPA